MKDELITLDTAILADEKGFKEHCDYCYSEKGALIQMGNYNGIENDYFPSISAPTQSLLKRWLREIHNLHIQAELRYKSDNDQTIGWNYDIEHMKVAYVAQPDKFKFKWIDHGENFHVTYESALEEGLFQALKLIKS